MEFADNSAWTFLNVSSLYWHLFRRWPYLQEANGLERVDEVDEIVLLGEVGQKISHAQAYPHRGGILKRLCLYDYVSVATLTWRGTNPGSWGIIKLEPSWPPSQTWVQVLRKPGKHAVVCLDGYLSMDFAEEDESHHRRLVRQSPMTQTTVG
jgi:hypothetical protein